MKAIIVNCADTFEYRVDMVYDSFISMGYDAEVLTTDYMHIEKKKRVVEKKDYLAINTIPYKKNISFARLYSHYDFEKKVDKILERKSFEVLYLVVPANSIARLAKKYSKYKNIKIIIDIIDLWPESLPMKITDKFPFTIWANVRNKNIKYADYVITECNLYKEKLRKQLKDKKNCTLYWCHRNIGKEYVLSKTVSNILTLCYLGSINNIIDIAKIGEIVKQLANKQPVVIKLIATGERKTDLIRELKNAGAEIIDYGKVYDYDKKKEIIDTCHYGINIMKSTVNVGISMKSVDYLEMGLPVINNLRCDLEELLPRWNAGINIFEYDLSNINVSSYDINMRNNARKLFEALFTEKVFSDKICKIINEEIEEL